MERLLLSSSTGLFGLAWGLSPRRGTRKLSRLVAWLGVLTGLVYLFARYYGAWPMTPMYLGSVAVPPFLALFGLWSARPTQGGPHWPGWPLTLGLVFCLDLLSVFFPKDFYLPFLKTASLFSQAHLLFCFLGKAAFLLAGVWAGLRLWAGPGAENGQTRLWLALGFALWTLAMLTGEAWSYLGWGLPVVWDEAVIVCFMASWFYYAAVLHLFVTSRWPRARLYLAVAGLVWVPLVNVLPDLGPWRWPPSLG
ncbi:MAG: cytochrome c biogenesis protein [Deltaproteobacteria bacterium]|jgi:hypothetical protein|nr:cytochrome c biogenesis protein [Deltaproteobacteria bacterium]